MPTLLFSASVSPPENASGKEQSHRDAAGSHEVMHGDTQSKQLINPADVVTAKERPPPPGAEHAGIAQTLVWFLIALGRLLFSSQSALKVTSCCPPLSSNLALLSYRCGCLTKERAVCPWSQLSSSESWSRGLRLLGGLGLSYLWRVSCLPLSCTSKVTLSLQDQPGGLRLQVPETPTQRDVHNAKTLRWCHL